MTDSETITVAVLYAALALVGPWLITMLMRWAGAQDAANLAAEIGAAMEGVTK